ncbi:hypothetical protein [Lysobacter enzymogenes]|uniref:hypothetical protein n=1 Tax=Lysobacter enzymogenes TaxID=69 RepID=UPI00089B6526|nr:hypothetical protein [Lysobacter enzymogenes]SDX00708.1 hypothetical protein SAMN05421681_103467 [Lysobacter enzymogenes]
MTAMPRRPRNRRTAALAAAAAFAFVSGFAAVSTAAPVCRCYAERTQCLAEAVTDLDKKFCRLEFNRCMDRFCPAPPNP